MKKVAFSLLLGASLAGMVSCEKGVEYKIDVNPNSPTLYEGETKTVTVTTEPEGVALPEIDVLVADEGIAKVVMLENGCKITGVKAGETTATLSYGEVSVAVKITVKKKTAVKEDENRPSDGGSSETTDDGDNTGDGDNEPEQGGEDNTGEGEQGGEVENPSEENPNGGEGDNEEGNTDGEHSGEQPGGDGGETEEPGDGEQGGSSSEEVGGGEIGETGDGDVEENNYAVYLTGEGLNGTKINLIKEVGKQAGCSVKDAQNLVNNTNRGLNEQLVKDGLTKAEADEVAAALDGVAQITVTRIAQVEE